MIDRVMLDAGDRHRRRIVLTAERGTCFLLDLPHATALRDGDGLVLEDGSIVRDGDGLVLEDGSIVRVASKLEPLVEVTAKNPHELARLAWHIGNRHIDVQIIGERMRIRRDQVVEDMLRGLGAQLSPVEAPFEREPGAYGHQHPHGQNVDKA